MKKPEWYDSYMSRRHVIHLNRDYDSTVEFFLKSRMKALANFLDDIYSIMVELYPKSSTEDIIHVWVTWHGSASHSDGDTHSMKLRRLTGFGSEAMHEAVHLALNRAKIPNDIVGTNVITGSRHHDLMFNQGLLHRIQMRYIEKRGLVKAFLWFEGVHLR